MKFHFVRIPIGDSAGSADALNQFLASHRMLSVERQFVPDGANSFWAMCLCYDDSTTATPLTRPGFTAKRGKVDFKEVLSDSEFAVFARRLTAPAAP